MSKPKQNKQDTENRVLIARGEVRWGKGKMGKGSQLQGDH